MGSNSACNNNVTVVINERFQNITSAVSQSTREWSSKMAAVVFCVVTFFCFSLPNGFPSLMWRLQVQTSELGSYWLQCKGSATVHNLRYGCDFRVQVISISDMQGLGTGIHLSHSNRQLYEQGLLSSLYSYLRVLIQYYAEWKESNI